MSTETVLIGIALVSGLYMAWSIGANDVANAMGTSVGSGALTLKRAVILASVLEFAGAFLVGTHVSETVRKGIISPEIFASQPMFLVYGMIAALLAAGLWLQLASYFGWPVSTTHSIVGSILGFGIVVGGFSSVNWSKVGEIVSSWIISPLLSGVIAFFIFRLIRNRIFLSDEPVKAAKKLTPFLVFFVFLILTLVMVFKGLKNLNLDLSFGSALLVAAGIGFLAAFISRWMVAKIKVKEHPERIKQFQSPKVILRIQKAIRNLKQAQKLSKGEITKKIGYVKEDLVVISKSIENVNEIEQGSDEYRAVERIFVYLQILSAAFVAFAHGANDVANAVGPLAAVVAVLQSGIVALEAQVPLWVLALGGIGIVIGLATWGWRVIETIGKKITELTPTRGFSAEFAAATTIVLASKLGLPISTTHTLVGAVLGVGVARGIGALNLRTVRNIVISWVVTIPVGAVLAIIFFFLFKSIF
jgi:PiT family inorganic phosphate transporter